MHSHGLRPWNDDDVQESRAIIQALQESRLSTNRSGGHSSGRTVYAGPPSRLSHESQRECDSDDSGQHSDDNGYNRGYQDPTYHHRDSQHGNYMSSSDDDIHRSYSAQDNQQSQNQNQSYRYEEDPDDSDSDSNRFCEYSYRFSVPRHEDTRELEYPLSEYSEDSDSHEHYPSRSIADSDSDDDNNVTRHPYSEDEDSEEEYHDLTYDHISIMGYSDDYSDYGVYPGDSDSDNAHGGNSDGSGYYEGSNYEGSDVGHDNGGSDDEGDFDGDYSSGEDYDVEDNDDDEVYDYDDDFD
ncbi:hypothetical protein C8Q75DRAFT_293733 [Abortiporus biennis]|nr:hypothetical protein C8Q75DRAFT_293733 [Abortiporus biennis]